MSCLLSAEVPHSHDLLIARPLVRNVSSRFSPLELVDYTFWRLEAEGEGREKAVLRTHFWNFSWGVWAWSNLVLFTPCRWKPFLGQCISNCKVGEKGPSLARGPLPPRAETNSPLKTCCVSNGCISLTRTPILGALTSRVEARKCNSVVTQGHCFVNSLESPQLKLMTF